MFTILANTRRPDISFYPDGRIDITARIAKALSLKEGDVIDIIFNDGEFLLYVSQRSGQRIGRHKATVMPTNSGKRHSNNFRTYSKHLAREMSKAAYDRYGMKTRLPAGEPISMANYGTAIPIITRNPL